MNNNNLLIMQAKSYLFWAKACKANNSPYFQYLQICKKLLSKVDVKFINEFSSITQIDDNMPTTTDITWTMTTLS